MPASHRLRTYLRDAARAARRPFRLLRPAGGRSGGLRGTRGQSTVEYLGLVLAVGALLLAASTQMKGGADGLADRIVAAIVKSVKAFG